MPQPYDLSVVIVAFGAAEYLERCLATVSAALADSRCRAEIVVVDNHSGDETANRARRACPAARVIALPVNVGFAGANNIGSLAASGRYLALLNPDTEVPPGLFDRLVDHLDQHPDIGIAAPRLDNGDGSLQVSCYRFPTLWNTVLDGTPLRWLRPFGRFGAHRYCDPSTDAPRDVEWASGACLVIPRALFESLDGFDERFFMYSEDVDLCRRVAAAGYRVQYVPDVSVVHHGNRSEGAVSDAVVARSARGAIQYQRIVRPRRSAGWLALALATAAGLGAVMAVAALLVRPDLAPRIRSKQEWRRRFASAVWRVWRVPDETESRTGLLRIKCWLRSQSVLARGCDRLMRSAAAVAIAAFEHATAWGRRPSVADLRQTVRHVVVTSFYGIGDALMDQPALAALRRALPDAHVRLLCSRRYAELFVGQPIADEVVPVDEARFFHVARDVARHPPDLYVMLHSNLEYYLFGRLSGARFRAGYLWDFRASRASGFAAAARPNRSRSRVVRGLEVPAMLGAPVVERAQPNWVVGPEDRASADRLLAEHGIAPVHRFVVVNPNKTASWLGAGRWPPQRWRRVLMDLRETHQATVVLVGSDAERDEVAAIAAGFVDDPSVVNLAGAASLRETAAILARADLVVTTDSGLMHLSGAVGVPVVSLFTFSDPASFATGARNHIVVGRVPCSPCVANHMQARDHYPPICPYDYRCGRALSVEAVGAAVRDQLALPAVGAQP